MDRIIASGPMDGEMKYRVRWLGYAEGSDSWEPARNIIAQHFIDEYEAARQRFPKRKDPVRLLRLQS